MKKAKFLLISVISLVLIGCKNRNNSQTVGPGDSPANYTSKVVDYYFNPSTIEKQITLRFYDATPNVPYIAVSTYFH